MIKAIKGKDKPADLGTKSLSRDKIRKYMVTIGYIGDYLYQELQEEAVEVRRSKVSMKKSFDERTVTRIIQAVATAVLISLSEACKGSKVKEEEGGQAEEGLMWIAVMLMMLMMVSDCSEHDMCYRSWFEALEKKERKKFRSAAMADAETVKKFITEECKKY